jgi:hypothetical protein
MATQLDLFAGVVHCLPCEWLPTMVVTPHGGLTPAGGVIHRAWLEIGRLGIVEPTQEEWVAALAVADREEVA